MKTKEELLKIFKCGKCESGEIEMTLKSLKDSNEIKIKKCSNCKHQYYLKQTHDLQEIKKETLNQ